MPSGVAAKPGPRRVGGVGGPHHVDQALVAGLYPSMSQRKPAAAGAAAGSALVTVGLLSRRLSVACCAGRPGSLNSGLVCSSRMHQTLFGNFLETVRTMPSKIQASYLPDEVNGNPDEVNRSRERSPTSRDRSPTPLSRRNHRHRCCPRRSRASRRASRRSPSSSATRSTQEPSTYRRPG